MVRMDLTDEISGLVQTLPGTPRQSLQKSMSRQKEGL